MIVGNSAFNRLAPGRARSVVEGAALAFLLALIVAITYYQHRDPWVGRTITTSLCGPFAEGNFGISRDAFCKPGRPFSVRIDRRLTADVYRATVVADGHRADGKECRPGQVLHLRPAFLLAMLDFAERDRVGKAISAAEAIDPLKPQGAR